MGWGGLGVILLFYDFVGKVLMEYDGKKVKYGVWLLIILNKVGFENSGVKWICGYCFIV